jgi:hypothetical protein
MKTVPSGRVECCMNGAREVSGTTMVGMPAPATLGPVPVMVKYVAPLEDVIVGALVTVSEEASVVDELLSEVVSVVDSADVLVGSDVEAVDDEAGLAEEVVASLLESDELPGSVAVLRFGRSVWARDGTIRRRKKQRHVKRCRRCKADEFCRRWSWESRMMGRRLFPKGQKAETRATPDGEARGAVEEMEK